MNKKLTFTFLLPFFLGACNTTISDWVAVGGSRADGTVKMAYEMGEFAKDSDVPMGRGKELAARRCRSWGYTDAEPFGGRTRQCIRKWDAWFECALYRVEMEFQCTGGQAPTPISPAMNYPANHYPNNNYQQGQWQQWR